MRWIVLSVAVSVSMVSACSNDDEKPGVEVILGRASAGPGSISQSVLEGGPNPPDTTITITNDGNCDVDYTVTAVTVDGSAWLSVAPTTGSVAAGGSGGLTASVDVVAPGLLAGTYTGTIQIDGVCAVNGRAAVGSPALISVNLTVAAASASIAVDQNRVAIDTITLQDQWRPTGGSWVPEAREYPSAVWTGYEMIIFGGRTAAMLGDGAAYDPLADNWRPISTVGAPTPRRGNAAVWTGAEMIIWSGTDDVDMSTDGALYDPAADTWRPMSDTGAPPPRLQAAAVWTGTEMLVWGGFTNGAGPRDDGGRYDPALDQWSPMAASPATNINALSMAVWTGTEMIVFEEELESAAYNPATDTWRELSSTFAPPGAKALFWTGREMITLYGTNPATYNPATDTWGGLSTSFPDFGTTAILRHTTAFTGDSFIMWDTDSGYGYYRLSAGMPFPMATGGSPGMRRGPISVWTGTSMIVWGGYEEPAGPVTNTGAIYE